MIKAEIQLAKFLRTKFIFGGLAFRSCLGQFSTRLKVVIVTDMLINFVYTYHVNLVNLQCNTL